MILPPPLTAQYWFELTPPPFTPFFGQLILITFLALTVLGIVAYVARLREGFDTLTQSVLARSGSRLLLVGLSGLVLCVFEYERVPILTMRIAYLVLIVFFAWSAWRIYQYAMHDVPEIRKRQQERFAFTKWLPKRKRK